MEKSHLEKIKSSQEKLLDWQAEEGNFIPLSGSFDPNYKGNIVLDYEIDRFLGSDIQKVLLLAGHSGSGKSLYTQGLVTRLWKNADKDSSVPVWISLPSCKNPEQNAIEETLGKCGLNESEIEELRTTQKFIFIFDGYDEINSFKNISVSHRLERWNAKIIITCRHEYLYLMDNFRTIFSWFERGKPNYLVSTVLYVKPFSMDQIEQYIKQYIANHPDCEWREWERYKQALEHMPSICGLIKTPFVLKLAVDALPHIVKNDSENKEFTLATLYDVIVKHWFMRQELKLKASRIIPENVNFQVTMWAYCKSLAQLMHQCEVSQVFYDTGEDSVFEDKTEENPFSRFFNPRLPNTQILMRSCFIRETSSCYYAFAHASLSEYFLTCDFYDSTKKTIIDEKKEVEPVKTTQTLKKKKSDYFNERLLVEESNIIDLLSDRIAEDPQYKQELLDRIQASRNNPDNAISAANSISVLIRAGVKFNGSNLSGVQIPRANISGGFFDSADISDSDLSHVKMHHVWLRGANLERTNMTGINIGEYPWFKQDSEINYFDFREDLQRLATTDENNIVIWDSNNGTKLITLRGHEDKINCLEYSPDGNQLISGSRDHTVRLWNMRTNAESVVLKGHNKWVKTVSFSSDGKRIASGSFDNTAKIWDVISKKEIVTLVGHDDYINCVKFSPSCKLLATASQDKTVRLWNMETYAESIVLKGHEWYVNSVDFSPDELRIATASFDKKLRIWEIASKELIWELSGHEGGVNCVKFSTDGNRLLSCSEDKSIRIWDTFSGETIIVLRGHVGHVLNVQFTEDCEHVYSSSADKTVRKWDIVSGLYPARLSGHDKKVNSIHIRPDYSFVLSGSLDETIRETDLNTGKETTRFNAHKNNVDCVKYRNDSKQFVTCGSDSSIKIWSNTKGKPSKTLRGHKGVVCSIAYSQDGKWLVSGGMDKFVRVWNLEDGLEHSQMKADNRAVNCVAFHPGCKQVASGGGDKNVKIWSINGGAPIYELGAHKDSVRCVQYSIEGDFVASGSTDKTLQIFDTTNRKSKAIFQGHDGVIVSLQFCSGAKIIVSGSEDMTVRVWNISTIQCISILRLHARVGDFSFAQNGRLVLGLDDGSLECWFNQNVGTESRWQLQWSTDIDSRNLCVDDLRIENVIGLSDQNLRLLAQRGVEVGAKLLTHVAALNRSPVHNNNNSNTATLSSNAGNKI